MDGEFPNIEDRSKNNRDLIVEEDLVGLLFVVSKAFSDTSVSRRSFLTGTGIIGLISAAPVSAGFSFAPTLRWSGSALLLSYREDSWTIDRFAFGPRAILRVLRRKNGWLIRLKRATLPGTSLSVDFDLGLELQDGTWIAALKMPLFHIEQQVELAEWLRGQPVEARIVGVRFGAGSGEVSVKRGRVLISTEDGLTLRLNGRTSISGQLQGSCESAVLCLRLPGQAGDGFDGINGWATRLSLETPALRSRAFASGNATMQVAIQPKESQVVSAAFWSRGQQFQQLSLIDGPARLQLRHHSQNPVGLNFERAVIAVSADSVGVAGHLARKTFAINAGNALALVSGDKSAPFSAVFRASQPPHFSTRVRSEALWLPVAGTHAAVLKTTGSVLDVCTQPPEASFGCIFLGEQPTIVKRLDGDVLHLRLGDSLVDLKLHLVRGFDLDSPGPHGDLQLKRRSVEGRYVEGRLVFEFRPPHTAETIFDGNGDSNCKTAGKDSQLTTGDSSIDCPPVKSSKARMSETARVAFDFPEVSTRSSALWRTRDLSLEQLTNWDGLTMAVDFRATSADDLKGQLAALCKQLEELGVNAPQINESLDTVLKKIALTLVAPSMDRTALPLTSDIYYSPSADASWERTLTQSGPSMPLFGMRLGHRNDPHLRAIHSKLLPLQKFPDDNDLKKAQAVLDRDCMSPLTAQHHRDIVGQTSVFGLPALRRIVDPNANPDSATPDSASMASSKVPRGGVVRPSEPELQFQYILDADKAVADEANLPRAGGLVVPPPETGIALATTFEEADVTLTSLGATMRLDWRGEPAILKPSNRLTGYNLERLAYQTWLGRDVRVIAVDKGFLLPLGVRASLFTLSERVFLPDAGGLPVAKEIKRTFITSPRTPKFYPAVNQPDGGRDFPASSITLLTTRTSDLIIPENAEHGGILVPGFENAGKYDAFWPMFRTGSGPKAIADVEWKCQIDDDVTPFSLNMIFVMSDKAANQRFIRGLVDHYNAGQRETPGPMPWPPRSIANLRGSRRTYAPRAGDSTSGGNTIDTAFDTDSWLMTARGRVSDDGQENFVMDARMNGVDQPPFYPSVRRAAVVVQSIDRLVGQPQGVIVTQFHTPYVKSGISGAKNMGEIFLEVVTPKIALDVARARQPATGGVAQPKTLVAALSRISGVVGGEDSKDLRASTKTTGALLKFDDAADGKFNPSQFFILNIFGVNLIDMIDMTNPDKKLLDSAPQLSELVDHGIASSELLDSMRTISTVVLEKIEGNEKENEPGIKRKITQGIDEFNRPLKQYNISFELLYPSLWMAYKNAIDKIVAQLREISAANSTQESATVAALSIAASAKPLMREIGALVRDPIPPLVDEGIDQLIGQIAAFEDAVKTVPDKVKSTLLQLAVYTDKSLAQIGADRMALLFGLNKNQDLFALIAYGPTGAQARRQLAETLLFEQVGAPVLAMLESIERVRSEVDGRVLVARAVLLDAAESAIRSALSKLAERLAEDTADANNILREGDIEALAVVLADAVVQELDDRTKNLSIADLKLFADTLPSNTDIPLRLNKEIDDRKAWFRATDTLQPTPLASFKEEVTSFVFAAAIQSARLEIKRIVELLEQSALARITQLAADALQSVLEGAIALDRLAKVARAGRDLGNWCDAENGALKTIKALGDTVLLPSADIDTAIGDIGSAIAAVTLPLSTPQAVADQFYAIKRDLLNGAAVAQKAAIALADARSKLVATTGGDVCAAAADAATKLAASIARRGDMAASLRGVAHATQLLERLVAAEPGPHGEFRAAVGPSLLRVEAALKRLIAGTSIGGAADLAGVWKGTIEPAYKHLLAGVGIKEFKDEIKAVHNRLVDDAGTLRSKLAVAQPDWSAAVKDAIALADPDRRFAGHVVETIALAADAYKKVDEAALDLLTTIAKALLLIHDAGLKALKSLQDQTNSNAAIAYLLMTAGKIDLTQAVKDVESNRNALYSIATATDFSKAKQELSSIGKPHALVDAIAAIAGFINKILQGQFADLFAETLRKNFTDLEANLRAVIKDFIPARISTRYEWNTDLSVKNKYFEMVSSTKNDLKINTLIEFDLITGRRNAHVKGSLRPFAITVPQLFRITFGKLAAAEAPGATFTSDNGSSPDFKANITNFELLSGLEFLTQLGPLLGLSGNGLYIIPSVTEIEVGYAFARDSVMIGTLTLSNIALKVYVKLPFTNAVAKFGFEFASRERPFLISQPPYGGGGHVIITSTASGNQTIDLSFMFGAVTEIKFGPLSGFGRIVAGIWIQETTIKAFVEAVGEGSIACFSICIYIGLTLTQSQGGSLDGEARFEFEFKVGWVTFGYMVTASRHIAGPDKKNRKGSLMDTTSKDAHVYRSTVPDKEHQWREYAEFVSLELCP